MTSTCYLLWKRVAENGFRTSPNISKSTLADSASHFGEIVSSLRDYAVFLLDRNGNIVTWNAGAEQIKGYRAEEIIGQHFSRFYTADSLSRIGPPTNLKSPR